MHLSYYTAQLRPSKEIVADLACFGKWHRCNKDRNATEQATTDRA